MPARTEAQEYTLDTIWPRQDLGRLRALAADASGAGLARQRAAERIKQDIGAFGMDGVASVRQATGVHAVGRASARLRCSMVMHGQEGHGAILQTPAAPRHAVHQSHMHPGSPSPRKSATHAAG